MKNRTRSILMGVRQFGVLMGLGVATVHCCPASSPPVSSAAEVTCPPGPAPAGKFEMQQYFMGFLRRGPAWSAEKTPEVLRISEGHMNHIKAMGDSGKLVLAGPFEVEGTPPNALAGILLFDVGTIEEARALAAEDPAVKEGRFTLEVIPWYGAKGITFPGKVGPEQKREKLRNP